MNDIHDPESTALRNMPATLQSNAKQGKFSLLYDGQTILQATVKVRRADQDLVLKDAGIKLFTLAKSDGWHVLTQTIRVAAIGLQDADLLLLRATITACTHAAGYLLGELLSTAALLSADSSVALPVFPVADHCCAVYHPEFDWLLSLDAGPTAELIPAKEGKFKLEAGGPELLFRFRPCYRARHMQTASAELS